MALGNMNDSRHNPLVTPMAEREPDAVSGAFYVVKGQCLICRLPCDTAPDNISWNDPSISEATGFNPDHCRVAKQPGDDKELDAMINAACGSCISAIRYCGSDAYTLARFREEGMAELCDALPEAGLDKQSHPRP